jgi:amino-acid N-acetyltransferase
VKHGLKVPLTLAHHRHNAYTSSAHAMAGAFPNSLTAAVRACKHGVKRTHVIYARTPGALLVELYSRDGLGVMVSGASLLQCRCCNRTLQAPD